MTSPILRAAPTAPRLLGSGSGVPEALPGAPGGASVPADAVGHAARSGAGASAPLTLTGRFAVFNTWTTISSLFEGTFLERVAPGAFTRTFTEDRDRMRVLFQHGQDPYVGSKPLGTITTLREDHLGAYYEVPLLATPYVDELVPGLEAGVYGASFRFIVTAEDWTYEPGTSTYNPQGLPERTIREAQVLEFGPVTFGAYPAATAGVRSLTDWYRTTTEERDRACTTTT